MSKDTLTKLRKTYSENKVNKIYDNDKFQQQYPQEHSTDQQLSLENLTKLSISPILNLTKTTHELASETINLASGLTQNIFTLYNTKDNKNPFDQIGLNIFPNTKSEKKDVCFFYFLFFYIKYFLVNKQYEFNK